MKSIRVAVFGAGSLGSVVGALLSRKNDVLLITRGEHLESIKESGLRVKGLIEETFYLDAESSYHGGYDLILLTVKAYDTERAAESISEEYGGEPVLTLQNGVGVVDILSKFNFDVIPAVTTMGATLLSPGVVKYAGYGDTFIGEKDGNLSERVIKIAQNFTESGLKTEVVNDIMERRWIKAAINACINPLTAIMGVRNGELKEEKLRAIVECVASECSEILLEMGIKEDVFSLAMDVVEKTAENKSSMLQDIEKGRPTEVDYIVKPFMKRGCTFTLYNMVKHLENNKR